MGQALRRGCWCSSQVLRGSGQEGQDSEMGNRELHVHRHRFRQVQGGVED